MAIDRACSFRTGHQLQTLCHWTWEDPVLGAGCLLMLTCFQACCVDCWLSSQNSRRSQLAVGVEFERGVGSKPRINFRSPP